MKDKTLALQDCINLVRLRADDALKAYNENAETAPPSMSQRSRALRAEYLNGVLHGMSTVLTDLEMKLPVGFEETASPQIVCCSCGRVPVVRMSPPLCLSCDPVLDWEAAELWRKENPEASVFKVSLEDKIKYARRILSLATPPA